MARKQDIPRHVKKEEETQEKTGKERFDETT
jgi:hypothetical protein